MNRCALPDVVADIVRVALSHHLDVAAAGGPDGAANAVPGVTEATAIGPNGVGDAGHIVAPDALWSRRRNTSCRPHRPRTVTPTTGHLSSRRQAHQSWKQLAAAKPVDVRRVWPVFRGQRVVCAWVDCLVARSSSIASNERRTSRSSLVSPGWSVLTAVSISS